MTRDSTGTRLSGDVSRLSAPDDGVLCVAVALGGCSARSPATHGGVAGQGAGGACSPPNDSCNARDVKFANGANNHLLVSIAQAFGVQTDTFGVGLDPAFASGALSGLT